MQAFVYANGSVGGPVTGASGSSVTAVGAGKQHRQQMGMKHEIGRTYLPTTQPMWSYTHFKRLYRGKTLFLLQRFALSHLLTLNAWCGAWSTMWQSLAARTHANQTPARPSLNAQPMHSVFTNELLCINFHSDKPSRRPPKRLPSAALGRLHHRRAPAAQRRGAPQRERL